MGERYSSGYPFADQPPLFLDYDECVRLHSLFSRYDYGRLRRLHRQKKY